MKEEQAKTIDVLLPDLKDNMVIVSYIGFADKFNLLDDKTHRWLCLNFTNTHFKIDRAGSELDCLSDQLQIGDKVLEIYNFPESHKKITIVNKALKNELQVRGFKKFRVIQRSKITPLKQEKNKLAVEETNDLVDKVVANVSMHQELVEAVENFIDDARNGILREKEIKNYVDEMISKTSADAISAIANLKKSGQIYGHCVDVSGIFNSVYSKIIGCNKQSSIFKDEKEVAFGGFLHDFGKAKIPKDILDSTVRFEMDSPEMRMIREHPTYGMEMLKEINQPDHILNMVHFHHLKLDTSINSSYPKNIQGQKVLWETRLLSIVDAYQSLIGKRNYKKSWSPPAAIRYLDALADVEFDPDAWEKFVKAIGAYPVSSLVQLNDESIAFVVNVPEGDLSKPRVVVVQDQGGNLIKTHSIIDLADELDFSIARDLDSNDYFGGNALEIFMKIQLV